MFQVIDSFEVVDNQSNNNYGSPPDLSIGTWFVLSPSLDGTNVEPKANQVIQATRPDGTKQFLTVTNMRISHSVVAIQFENINKSDLPRLSEIQTQTA